MKKTSNLIILVLGVMLFSCKYDYNELDMSKVRLRYQVSANKETKKTIAQDIEKTIGYTALVDETSDWSYGVEEYDIDGKLLYKGSATNMTQEGTRTMNLYDSLKTILPVKSVYIPWMVLKRSSGVLDVSPKIYDLSLNNSKEYTIELAPDSLWIYKYFLKCTHSGIIKKCHDLGYEIAGTEYYNEELDKKGNIIIRRKQEEAISVEKAVDVISSIDIYGWRVENGYTDYNNETHVMSIKFSPLKIKNIAGKRITLTENDQHTIDVYVKRENRYWLEFSCAEISSKLTECGYELSDAQYYISEFDGNGNLIRTREKPKSSSSDKWLFAAENAATVQAYIDVYGWKYRTDGSIIYNEVKVFTVYFNKLSLENIKGRQTTLTANDPHTYVYYVDNAIPVTGVSLNTSSVELKVGYITNLKATVTPSNATNTSVSWTSSNPSVASVSSGKVSGVSAGVAIITCKTNDGGYTATCPVTVTDSGSSTTNYTVSVSSNNTTMGTVTGGGQYASGTVVTLTATPKSGYKFTKWSDGTTKNPYTFTVNKDISLTAYFENESSEAYEITCEEAAEIAASLPHNTPTTETYTVIGYVTETDGVISREQQRFWMADIQGGGNVFQSYWGNVTEAVAVGDKVSLTGQIMRYNSTYQIKNGDVVLLQPNVQDLFWNFSNNEFNSLGTISSQKTINGLTINATSSGTVVIDASSHTIDNLSFTHRLKLNGTGTANYRSLKFNVAGDCTIDIYLKSANSSENRILRVDFGTFNSSKYQTISATSSIAKRTISYTGNATTIYVYGAAGGVNLYGIQINYNSSM